MSPIFRHGPNIRWEEWFFLYCFIYPSKPGEWLFSDVTTFVLDFTLNRCKNLYITGQYCKQTGYSIMSMCNSDSEFSFYWNFIHDNQPKKKEEQMIKTVKQPWRVNSSKMLSNIEKKIT